MSNCHIAVNARTYRIAFQNDNVKALQNSTRSNFGFRFRASSLGEILISRIWLYPVTKYVLLHI